MVGFLSFGTINTLTLIILWIRGKADLCIVGCLTAFLTSALQMPEALPQISQMKFLQMSPNVPWGRVTKSPLVENHWDIKMVKSWIIKICYSKIIIFYIHIIYCPQTLKIFLNFFSSVSSITNIIIMQYIWL